MMDFQNETAWSFSLPNPNHFHYSLFSGYQGYLWCCILVTTVTPESLVTTVTPQSASLLTVYWLPWLLQSLVPGANSIMFLVFTSISSEMRQFWKGRMWLSLDHASVWLHAVLQETILTSRGVGTLGVMGQASGFSGGEKRFLNLHKFWLDIFKENCRWTPVTCWNVVMFPSFVQSGQLANLLSHCFKKQWRTSARNTTLSVNETNRQWQTLLIFFPSLFYFLFFIFYKSMLVF